MSHAPEVLADLVARLRRERPAAELPATSSTNVYFVPREEVAAAYAARVLEPDTMATRLLCGDADRMVDGERA